MEYARDRGLHADLPFDALLRTFREYYGEAMFTADQSAATDSFTRGS